MRRILFVALMLPVFAWAQVKFSNQSELSTIQTGGNSNVETYNLKTLSLWKGQKQEFSFGGHYTLGLGDKVDPDTGDKEKIESARNWDVGVKYDRTVHKRLSAYAGLMYEGNTFKGYKQRQNSDLGLKHSFIGTDKTQSSLEVGARYTVEMKLLKDDKGRDIYYLTKGRVFYQITHKQKQDLTYNFWIEYLPNFTVPEDYLVNLEPSVAFALSSFLSLKTSYKLMYDNQPNVDGYKYTDYTFTTALLATF